MLMILQDLPSHNLFEPAGFLIYFSCKRCTLQQQKMLLQVVSSLGSSGCMQALLWQFSQTKIHCLPLISIPSLISVINYEFSSLFADDFFISFNLHKGFKLCGASLGPNVDGLSW